jgi:hypothetical protein
MKTRVDFAFYNNRDFCTDGFYPYRNRGWRAQRAMRFVGGDEI